MMERIPIVIVSYNRKDMLEKCLAGIRKNTDPDFYDLVLVDNGSDSETADFIKEQKLYGDIFSTIRIPENKGFAIGYNAGLKLVNDRDFLIILNNDTIPASGWLEKLHLTLSYFYKLSDDPKIGLILPYTNSCCNPGIVVEDAEVTTKTIGINGNVPAVCWGITQKCYTAVCQIIEKLGGGYNFFHKDFEYGWAEDILTSEIISRLGFSKYAAGESFIYHHGSATQNILKVKEDYRADNMGKLGKCFKILDEIDKKTFDMSGE